MAGTLVSTVDLATALKVDTAELNNELTSTGVSPVELAGHTTKREYILSGITPADFASKHAGVEIDYSKLQKEFKEFCVDYCQPLEWDRPSQAVEFCSKIIYEIGPESRQVKKADGDRVWKFKFASKDIATNKPVVKVVFVATFKSDSNNFKKTIEKNKMILTVKQANLLAIDTFIRVSEMTFGRNGTILLTPLAGAVFARTDLIQLSANLNMSSTDTVNMLNSSCQSGGHLLPHATGACAAVAALLVTRNVKDEKVRKSIITKTIKQYYSVDKEIVLAQFKELAKYAHGGLPSGYDVESLEAALTSEQKISVTARQAANAIAMSTIKGTVNTPTSPTGQGTSGGSPLSPPLLPPKSPKGTKRTPTPTP